MDSVSSIPDAIKSNGNYVNATNDVKAVDFQATQMGKAIKYVDGSNIDMTSQTNANKKVLP